MNPAEADWDCHRAFLAVLAEGSLSAASRRLNLAQPTVRHRIEALEQALGAPLFTRSPIGLEPTALARQLAEPARAMELAAEAFLRTASGEAEGERGTVRITASEVVGVEVLPPILAALRLAHPGLHLELGLSNRNEDLLRREADIAIRMVPPRQKALVARRVGAVRLGLHAHRHYLAAHGMPASTAALRGHAMIGYEQAALNRRWLPLLGLEMRALDLAFRTDSDLGQLAAIRAGLGIGGCQSALAARDPGLVPVLPAEVALDLDTWIVMHEDQRGLRRVRLVFDHLVEGLAAYCAPGRPAAARTIAGRMKGAVASGP